MTPNEIKKIRHKIGYSQSQFAKFLDISIKTLQHWEQGDRKPTGPAESLLLLHQHRIFGAHI